MNEDYDSAKVIKAEIDKVRASSFIPWIEDLIAQHLGPTPKSQSSQMRYTQQQFNQA
jgi:hypothetical protein